MHQYAVVGSGYMGGGIAQVLALSGTTVVIADVSETVAANNYDRLLAESERFVADGLLAPGATETLRKNLRAAASVEEAVAEAEFIEESVIEDVDVKRDVLSAISSVARPAAIIGSNTSTISIGTLAEAVRGRERFLGVHFSNPAPFVPGVELIPHAKTEPRVVVAVETIIRRVGKQPAQVRDVTGFVLNRLQFALFHEAAQLAEEGVASAEDIDRIVRTTFGFGLPFSAPSLWRTWRASTCTPPVSSPSRRRSATGAKRRKSFRTLSRRAGWARRAGAGSLRPQARKQKRWSLTATRRTSRYRNCLTSSALLRLTEPPSGEVFVGSA
jgi:3-hydroxybutyryl-CoA dehydrogenase